MSQKHIVINKIENRDGTLQLLMEGISIEEIRSFRKWNAKDGDKYESISKVTVLYMKPSKDDNYDPRKIKQIHIAEDMDDFCERLGVSVPKNVE